MHHVQYSIIKLSSEYITSLDSGVVTLVGVSPNYEISLHVIFIVHWLEG